MSLADHYGFDDSEAFDKLNISIKTQIESIRFFLPVDSSEREKKKLIDRPLPPIAIYHFIDNKGGKFISKPVTPSERIARLMFDNLTSKDKLKVIGYAEMMEN